MKTTWAAGMGMSTAVVSDTGAPAAGADEPTGSVAGGDALSGVTPGAVGAVTTPPRRHRKRDR
jgi:hypothetical protein